MQESIQQLASIISVYPEQLTGLHEDKWMFKPSPSKWSRKEVMGHLIDSAQNNIRRFIIAQYEDTPTITYAQDNWVTSANYENYITSDLVTLWVLLNRHICHILNNIPDGGEQRLCNTGELRSIEWLASDYNKHLLHHLHQLLDMEPVAYP